MCYAMELDTQTSPTLSPLTSGSTDEQSVSNSTTPGADEASTNHQGGDAQPQQPTDAPKQVNMEESEAPTLLEKALAAMAQKGKGALNKGDTVVLLDEEDLSKTVRLDSSVLLQHVPAVKHELVQGGESKVAVHSPREGIAYLLVLGTPWDEEVPSFRRANLGTAAPIDKIASTPRPANQMSKRKAKVKNEPVDGVEDTQAAEAPAKRSIDWPRAFECLFRILKNSPNVSLKTCKLPSDALEALPLIEGVLAIGEQYHCSQSIVPAFKALMLDWVSNQSLYPAIAGDAHGWIIAATKLQSEPVWKEAYIHLAGQHPNANIEGLSEEVTAAIKKDSLDLGAHRSQVDLQLLTTSLKIKVDGDGRKKLGEQEAIVGQHHAPVAYSTVNVWRDWIAEHLSYLKDIDDGDEEADNINSTAFCDHPSSDVESTPDYLTVAGFYRTLYEGGDSYLVPEEVTAKWNKKFPHDGSSIRQNLKILKARARDIVAPLAKSSLQYEKRDTLPYLTCVEAIKVPWLTEGDDEDEDDENMEVD